MGKLWDLIEQHRDKQRYPPTYRKLAEEMGVRQSNFDVWRNPKSLPRRENLEAIAHVTNNPYHVVLEAAIEDTRYRIPPSQDPEASDDETPIGTPSVKRVTRPAAVARPQPDPRSESPPAEQRPTRGQPAAGHLE